MPWCTPRPAGTTPEDRANQILCDYNDIESREIAAVRQAGGDLFGLVLGAAIANDHPYYAQRCGWETQAYPGPYGQVQYEQVQVCR